MLYQLSYSREEDSILGLAANRIKPAAVARKVQQGTQVEHHEASNRAIHEQKAISRGQSPRRLVRLGPHSPLF